jgi:transcriptional regulator
MPPATRDRLRGTLDLLVLRTLVSGSRHGYAISQWIAQQSGDVVRIEEGSLYPALYRLEERTLIASEWKTSELGRPAKFYKLTAAGRKYLRDETADWLSFSDAVTRILQPAT